MSDYVTQVKESSKHIRTFLEDTDVSFAVLTGTGQSNLLDEFTVVKSIPYADIPFFPLPSVETHRGTLYLLANGNTKLLLFAGRLHYYEGFGMDQVTYPVRVVQELKISKMIFTNAVGGVSPDLEEGDIGIVTDHINLHAANPLRGENISEWGVRFPEMLDAYSKGWRDTIHVKAASNDIDLKNVVYVGTQGPNLETPAEYRFFNIIGGDVVGMSTIPEVIVANHANIECIALSIVTNKCYPFDKIKSATIEEIIDIAKKATPKLAKLIKLITQ